MPCHAGLITLYTNCPRSESTVSPSARIRLNGRTMTQKQHIKAAAVIYRPIHVQADFPCIRHIDCLLQFASQDDHTISSSGGRAMFR